MAAILSSMLSRPTPFQPIDADVLNASIPAYFIGRDKDGFWLAREAGGHIGGIFLLESSAVAFARKQSRPSGCAMICSSERFELDLENQGNPLIEYLRPVVRLAINGLRRTAALTGRTAEAIKRRLKGFLPT